MKKNQLLEAAAEILKQSLSSAPGMPPQKLEGSEIDDLGGDTPQEHSDSKLDVKAKEATPPGKQPGSETKAPLPTVAGKPGSATDPTDQGEASADQAEWKRRVEAGLSKGELKEEEKKDEDKDDKDEDSDEDKKDDDKKDDEDKKKMDEEWKKNLKEDVAAILKSESNLPKEFATKVGTIYEARVSDKVSQIQESLEAEYAKLFEAAVLEVRESLTEQVNDYLDYVVEEWMKQNELAIEKGLRSELTEEFIGGLRELFAEHYIDVPAEKVDVVDELATKVEELQGQLNEEIAKSIELKKQLGESKKHEILNSVCEGLTQTQVEKVRTLAESVEFTAEGDYKSKVSTIRENYFPVSTGKKTDTNAKMLTEASEVADEKPVSSSFEVSSVADAIAKTIK